MIFCQEVYFFTISVFSLLCLHNNLLRIHLYFILFIFLRVLLITILAFISISSFLPPLFFLLFLGNCNFFLPYFRNQKNNTWNFRNLNHSGIFWKYYFVLFCFLFWSFFAVNFRYLPRNYLVFLEFSLPFILECSSDSSNCYSSCLKWLLLWTKHSYHCFYMISFFNICAKIMKLIKI